MKKKAFEDAGIPVKQISIVQQVQIPQQQSQQQQLQQLPLQGALPQQQQQQQLQIQPLPQVVQTQIQEVTVQADQNQLGIIGNNSDIMMTLNRLNTHESEVDVESLSTSEVKLDFDSEEVAG